MVNVVVTVEASTSEIHSGMFGGAAPDALAALVAMLATLRDEHGNTTITGLDNTRRWSGAPYPPEQFRHGRRRARGRLPARRRQRLGHALGATCGDHPGHRLPAGRRLRSGHRAEGGGAAEPAHPARPVARGGRARPGRAPPRRGAVGGALHGGDRGDRVPVRGRDRRAGVPRDGRGDAGGLRGRDGSPRTGRVDPAVQRVRGDLPRRRAHPDGGRGAVGPDPRPQRERGPERDRPPWPWPRPSSWSATRPCVPDGTRSGPARVILSDHWQRRRRLDPAPGH